jgi:hypothetical protein
LVTCQADLSSWSSRKFDDVAKKKKTQKTKKLELLQREEGLDNYEAIKVLKELDFIMEHEDIKWKQRAKQSWYQHGDRKTSFFHAWGNHRRKINQIKKVVDEAGSVWKKQKEIGAAFVRYYTFMFTTGEVHGVTDCLGELDGRVTREMNDALTRTFMVAGVDFALHQMHPLKSTGLDGFSAYFYQNS